MLYYIQTGSDLFYILLVWGLILLVGQAVIITGSVALSRERQRSPVWIWFAWVPGLGFLTTTILAFLKPIRHCCTCNRGVAADHMACPSCGRLLPEPPRPRLLRANEIHPGVGLAIIGLGWTAIMTAAYFILVHMFIRNWEYRMLQARLVEDPAVTAKFGEPIRIAVPSISTHPQAIGEWAEVQTTLKGPKGEASFTCQMVSCGQHGWHFTKLTLVPEDGTSTLELSDQHPSRMDENVYPCGKVPRPTTGISDFPGWPDVVMARICRDPSTLQELGGPLAFPVAPALRPLGPGQWTFEAKVQGPSGSGVVKGTLKDAPPIRFPEFHLERSTSSPR